jgi:glycosyltransferase involved in cell wall biosynthesis
MQTRLVGSLEDLKVNVSIVVCVRNEEQYIGKCINSILNQSFLDFELVIIDDISTDNTRKIIEGFNDKRLKYFRNEKWLGISESRNNGVKHAVGDYIFFTDGDCTVARNWIEEGLKCFREQNCVAVEGSVYYVSKDFAPSFSDYVMENKFGNRFMTGSMAYKKKIVETVGGFDKKLTYHEDRDIALKIMKLGKISFKPEMIVYHPRVVLSPAMFIKAASHTKYRVFLFKKFGDKECLLWRILLPLNLVKIFFPPLIFGSLFSERFRDSNDYRLLPYSYVYVIVERLQLWKTCAIERVFLI